jgi:putative ABC transport system permease protein
MLTNYFKSTFRNLYRYKGFTFINIVGLTVGLATSIFIFLWVTDELTYDRFHENGDRIYRVMSNLTYTDGSIETAWATPLRLADAMKELPEVEHSLQMTWEQVRLFTYEDKSFNESGYYADSTIFKIFSFPITYGDSRNPLPDINSIAIAETVAKKYFGDENAIGKVFRLGKTEEVKVTAVFADLPENSTLKFSFILPFYVWEKSQGDGMKNWGNSNMQTFASLKPAASLENANRKLNDLVKKNCADCISSPFLFPYSDLRLHSRFNNGVSVGGRIDFVMTFSIVAIIILIIACINFMNLTTARSSTRSKEVGVRKVVGAQRSGLIAHFLGESILLTFISLLFALALVQLLLPFFNEITDKIIFLNFRDPVLIIGLLSIALFCGVTAGSYPALFLSSFKPAAVLKGVPKSALSGTGLRKTLVIFQFTISVVLIIVTIVVYNQIEYIRSIDLGLTKENVILLGEPGGVYTKQEAYKNGLLQYPKIKNVGIAGHNPFSVDNTTTDPIWPGKPQGTEISFKVIMCDQHFIPTMKMKMIEGRNFSDDYKRDSVNYVINEKAMEVMGLDRSNVIGTDLEMWNGKGKIIGVVNNFINGNLREALDPLIFLYAPMNTWRVFVRYEGSSSEVLAHIKKVHEEYDAGSPFEYSFLDQEFDGEYKSERVMGTLAQSFTIVAILISCLGLLGLASFTAERRMKELGIRKVLGASVGNLIMMLCSDFTRLVFIGLIVGTPIAWYIASRYLSHYAFHPELDKSIFVLTAAAVMVIALGTVIYQSARAAMTDPVDSLRNE